MMSQWVYFEYLKMSRYWWGALYSNMEQQKKLHNWKVQPSIGENLIEAEPGSLILSYPASFLSSTS